MSIYNPLPIEVVVGATRYSLSRDDLTDLYGETDHRRQTIRLGAAQQADSDRDTLLHEVLHAIMWTAGGPRVSDLDDEAEERLIRILSPWLLMVMRQNRALVDYLMIGAGA